MSGVYGAYMDGSLAADTSALPSPILWSKVDIARQRPGLVTDVFEDFKQMPLTLPTTQANYGDRKMFTVAGGTYNDADAEGGVKNAVEATDNEGYAIGMASFPFKIIANAGELVFEARIKKKALTVSNLFVGLIESAVFSTSIPITTSGAMSDNNWVGFFQPEADPDGADAQYKANGVTAVTVKADAATLVADEWIKLGMLFNRGGDNLLHYLVNGVSVGSKSLAGLGAGDDFPNDVRMGWAIAGMGGAASSIDDYHDWVRVAQFRTTT